jgi:hypothetical protein
MAANVVLSAMKHAWITLAPLNLPMALMGGLALAVWQRVRATRDVDLLISLHTVELAQVLNVLAGGQIHAKPGATVKSLGSLRIMQLEYEPPGAFVDVNVDLLLADSDYHREALARRVAVRLPEVDLEIYVLACEDMILHKLLAGRVIDRSDVTALLRIHRQKLDRPYLLEWVGALKLENEFNQVWHDAFPDKPVLSPE